MEKINLEDLPAAQEPQDLCLVGPTPFEDLCPSLADPAEDDDE